MILSGEELLQLNVPQKLTTTLEHYQIGVRGRYQIKKAEMEKACGRRVRVRGREGEEVEWSRKAARRAGRLNDWLNDLDPSEDTVFPINETATTVLRTLGAMCDDDDWSASRLDECSLTQLAALIEGASNLIAEQALEYAQTAFARRLDGKRANELRELLGAVDDFESDEERVEALAEPAFTPDSPVPQSTTAGPPALPVNDDAAEAALAKVDLGTLIELKGVNRAWRALGRRALCSRLCRRKGHADPRQLDEITELNLQLLIEASRPWEAVRAGRLLVHLERLTGYGFVVDVAAVRLVNLDDDGGEEEEEEEVEEEEDTPLPLLRGPARHALCCCVTGGEGEPPLALLLGAIACAGSGEILGIPVEELRADTLSGLDLDLAPSESRSEQSRSKGMIGPEGAMLIASVIPVTAVFELNLSSNKIGDAGAKAIAGALSSGTAMVTNLYLYNNSIGDEGAKAIAEAMKVNAVMTKLSLMGNKIGNDGAIVIAEALKVNAVVNVLHLWNNSIGDDGAKAIAEALNVNAVVTNLQLGLNQIGAEGAIAIAEALKVNAVLTKLSLSENNIGAEGAIAIAEALKVNAVVTKLWLNNNNIGPEGAIVIAEALKDAVKGRSGFQLHL